MIVLDTHAWLWWLTDDGRLPGHVAAVLRLEDEVAVPGIVLWELAMLVSKGRLALGGDLLGFLRSGLEWEGVRLQPITAEIAARTALLPPSFHGDPADRLIVATALELDAPLVTVDERITKSAIPGLVTVW